ncbi:MAG: hypothetical protein HYT12_01730 [Candidatus Liptonbacteria bacterium]|nr:hypothetical protein [Candidatus Liptonbacteria bacterium]
MLALFAAHPLLIIFFPLLIFVAALIYIFVPRHEGRFIIIENKSYKRAGKFLVHGAYQCGNILYVSDSKLGIDGCLVELIDEGGHKETYWFKKPPEAMRNRMIGINIGSFEIKPEDIKADF